jgi:DNA-binding LacI/PurR family transcriptional regulator
MNLDQVARRAKVSTATVSRVLNEASLVKSSTRDRVLKAIEELKYHPNLHARSLAWGKSRSLGVIVSNLENPFFFDIYKTIEGDARAQGYEVAMAHTGYRAEQLVASVRLMIGRRVAGLAVVVSERAPELMEELADSRIPAVFYDGGAVRANATGIRVDYRRGIGQVVDYLHGLGHRRLGFVGHDAAFGPTSEPWKAVMDAAARIPELEVRAAAGADTLEGGRQAARDLLSTGFQPTAMVCVNDIVAVGALRELRERGLRVPEDMSVTGFGNVKLAEFCYPALTTLHIPREQIGHIISESLLSTSEEPAAGDTEIVIDPELVLRGSTGPAPRGS